MKIEVKDLLSTSEVQMRVVSLIKTMGYVSSGDKFSNIKLSKIAKEVIKQDVTLSDDFIETLREIFPPGHRGIRREVKEKAERFIRENSMYTESHILKAAQRWVQEKGEYCGYLQYFFYKVVDKVEQSRCLEYCELVTTSDTSSSSRLI